MPKQITALHKTLRALRAAKRITGEHAALVSVAEGMAKQIDDCEGRRTDAGGDVLTAALWKEYRGAVVALLEVGVDDSNRADVVAIVGLPSSLGHPSNAG